ncbi:hypothetical protein BJV82DRAFT_610792 [Fennellomyces sp. T-0311]|nr:hypothetical protein BJV82DRAFT_610792 [Fennellomyces sp. T-0311]
MTLLAKLARLWNNGAQHLHLSRRVKTIGRHVLSCNTAGIKRRTISGTTQTVGYRRIKVSALLMTLCMCLVVATAKEALARTALDVGTTAPNQQSEQARTREPLQSSSSVDTTNEPSSAAVPASNCLVLTVRTSDINNSSIAIYQVRNHGQWSHSVDEGYQVQAAGAVSTNANDPSMRSPTP